MASITHASLATAALPRPSLRIRKKPLPARKEACIRGIHVQFTLGCARLVVELEEASFFSSGSTLHL
jgi:hypothetical protein